MRINVQCTARGLIPLYDEDLDEKKRLRLGQVYEVTVKRPRNLAFHRKFFALINIAWQYQSEIRQEKLFRNSMDVFRHTVMLNAGICERIWSTSRKEFVDIPKSVSFAKMDEAEFEKCYNACLDVILRYFVNHVPESEFKMNIEEFLK